MRSTGADVRRTIESIGHRELLDREGGIGS